METMQVEAYEQNNDLVETEEKVGLKFSTSSHRSSGNLLTDELITHKKLINERKADEYLEKILIDKAYESIILHNTKSVIEVSKGDPIPCANFRQIYEHKTEILNKMKIQMNEMEAYVNDESISWDKRKPVAMQIVNMTAIYDILIKDSIDKLKECSKDNVPVFLYTHELVATPGEVIGLSEGSDLIVAFYNGIMLNKSLIDEFESADYLKRMDMLKKHIEIVGIMYIDDGVGYFANVTEETPYMSIVVGNMM